MSNSNPSMSTPLPSLPLTSDAETLVQDNKPQAQQAQAQAQGQGGQGGQGDMAKYGTHQCTCDGCNARPIIGFRYKCTKCRDHDICENCYSTFINQNVLLHVNKLNPLSKDPTAHSFLPHVDGKSFTGIAGVKKAAPVVNKSTKTKPNDPCHCNSGKKFKKCCGAN